MGPRGPGARRKSPALVVSLGLHALVLAVLVLSVRPPPTIVEPPPVQVELIQLPRTDPIMQPQKPLAPPPLLPRPAATPPVDAPPPPQDLRGTAERAPRPQLQQAPQRGERDPYLSFYQDNLKGCEKEALMLMPAPEQERCRARIAAAALQAARPFRNAGPPIEALSGLSAARRALLDAEVERRARSSAPMGRPVRACDGPGANLGAGCLPDPTD